MISKDTWELDVLSVDAQLWKFVVKKKTRAAIRKEEYFKGMVKIVEVKNDFSISEVVAEV